MYLCSLLHGQATSASPRGERRPDRVHARNERAVAAENVVDVAPHSRHQLHADDDVRAVGELYPDVRDVTAERPHRERHDVHGAPAHASIEQPVQRRSHLCRRHPVVGRTRIVLLLAADERPILDARDVRRVGPRKETVRPQRRIELRQRSRGDHLVAEARVFGVTAVAPHHALGLRQNGDVADPREEARWRTCAGAAMSAARRECRSG